MDPYLIRRRADFFVDRLGRESLLRGHSGCVNRLDWNSSGTLLASGSDDTNIRLWKYPDNGSSIIVPTSHDENIFGVRFLHSDEKIVSCGMDHTVQLHRLDNQGACYPMSPNEHHTTPVHTTVYNCHTNRVKQVEVHPEEPNLFWSASEDGTARQFDLRVPRSHQDHSTSKNVLLKVMSFRSQEGGRFESRSMHLQGMYKPLELKSIAINPAKGYEMAVAASDEVIRIYDRRRMTLQGEIRASDQASRMVLKLVPPHIGRFFRFVPL